MGRGCYCPVARGNMADLVVVGLFISVWVGSGKQRVMTVMMSDPHRSTLVQTQALECCRVGVGVGWGKVWARMSPQLCA